MMDYQSDFLHQGCKRGLLLKVTENGSLDSILRMKKVVGYIGFDATAESLHVGHLLQIRILRLLQESGHKPIVLVGGGTTQVGDPSGQSVLRKTLSSQQIDNNIISISRLLKRYITFGNNLTDAILMNNADWLLCVNYMDFLRENGENFSVNHMLRLDSVRSRLERKTHMSFLELNYIVLQAYDFLTLYKRNGCLLQLGGKDQWGNITLGIDFVRRVTKQEVYGVVSPLILTSEGIKMGKTSRGSVWLDENLSSPFEFWQYWRNVNDRDVGRFLRLFTDLPLEDIEELENLKNQEINVAKKILADEVTLFCHGKQTESNVCSLPNTLLENTGPFNDLVRIPSINLQQENIRDHITVADLIYLGGLVASKSEARRAIRGCGVKINGVLVRSEKLILNREELSGNQSIVLSLGKKKHKIIRVV